MVGKSIVACCPICKKTRYYEFSFVPMLRYKNEEYYLVYCEDCKKKILVKDLSITTSISKGLKNVQDNTKEQIVSLIINEFKNKNYNDETSEEQIEKDMFDFAKKIKGEEWCNKYQYEIKSIIQIIMTKTFHKPTTNVKSYIYEDVVEDCEIVATCCL